MPSKEPHIHHPQSPLPRSLILALPLRDQFPYLISQSFIDCELFSRAPSRVAAAPTVLSTLFSPLTFCPSLDERRWSLRVFSCCMRPSVDSSQTWMLWISRSRAVELGSSNDESSSSMRSFRRWMRFLVVSSQSRMALSSTS